MVHSRRLLPAIAVAFMLGACGRTPVIEVCNHLDEERIGEIVEVPIADLGVSSRQTFILCDSGGVEIPYQITYDSLLIFPASVAPLGTSSYFIKEGVPAAVDTVVTGAVYPGRLDDIAWENEHSGYRIYGPAFEAKGGKVYGYDIHTKSVEFPVVAERYRRELTQANWDSLRQLRAEGRMEEADTLERWISYHVDSGTGMDPYVVGPTLGAGVSAFMRKDSTLVYPRCYSSCRILDNGPLRFTVDMTFGAIEVDGDTSVIEHRLLTLDSGALLNRMVLRYDGLTNTQPLATGLVVHKQNPEEYLSDSELGIISYADSTDNPRNGNGVIYVGVFAPSRADSTNTSVAYLALPEETADAVGHIALIGDYVPGSEYEYYWGSGWSKHGIPTTDDWMDRMRGFARRVNVPLDVKVK
ncbi:DUF4861 family protein [uncultured Muribaculum sp.]|uniref:DUF4861 family protein n=1 Tax=uncultured Muribaculum sp. TaxID=1918613 RepID=UPI0025CB8069|nr:DUF4861 family protein [uncultured Muribaculum sp.]